MPDGKGQATKKDKLALFGSRKAPVILFDTTSALVLDLIIRYLCPFVITDGLGFAKNAWAQWECFGRNYCHLLLC